MLVKVNAAVRQIPSLCQSRIRSLNDSDGSGVMTSPLFFPLLSSISSARKGKSETDEYKDNLHKLSGCLRGQRGLLFTNSTKDEVTKWFESYSDIDFARTGCSAEDDVVLNEGPLEQFSHSMEPQVSATILLFIPSVAEMNVGCVRIIIIVHIGCGSSRY